MLNTSLIFLLGLLASWFLPWWSVALAAFGVLVWRPTGSAWPAFGLGFIGSGLLWGSATLYIHWKSDGLLTDKMAVLFGAPTPWLLVLASVLLAGLTGGLSAVTGYMARRVWDK